MDLKEMGINKIVWFDSIFGPFGEEIANESEERLINICKTYNLKITNAFFYHKNMHRYTWERFSLNLKSITNYIIIKQE